MIKLLKETILKFTLNKMVMKKLKLKIFHKLLRVEVIYFLSINLYNYLYIAY